MKSSMGSKLPHPQRRGRSKKLHALSNDPQYKSTANSRSKLNCINMLNNAQVHINYQVALLHLSSSFGLLVYCVKCSFFLFWGWTKLWMGLLLIRYGLLCTFCELLSEHIVDNTSIFWKCLLTQTCNWSSPHLQRSVDLGLNIDFKGSNVQVEGHFR